MLASTIGREPPTWPSPWLRRPVGLRLVDHGDLAGGTGLCTACAEAAGVSGAGLSLLTGEGPWGSICAFDANLHPRPRTCESRVSSPLASPGRYELAPPMMRCPPTQEPAPAFAPRLIGASRLLLPAV